MQKYCLIISLFIVCLNSAFAQMSDQQKLAEEIQLAKTISEKLIKYQSVKGIKVLTGQMINTNEVIIQHGVATKTSSLVNSKITTIEKETGKKVATPITNINNIAAIASKPVSPTIEDSKKLTPIKVEEKPLRKTEILKNGDIEETIAVNNVKRKYIVHAPTKKGLLYSGIVILLGSTTPMNELTKFNKVAQAYNLVTVYPDQLIDGDDSAFVQKIIEQTTNEYKTKKLYMVGFSTGGLATMQYGCQLKEIKAIATVAALYPEKLKKECKNIIPSLLIVGTSDPIMPYYGGKINIKTRVTITEVLSSEDSLNFLTGQKNYDKPKIEKFYNGEIDYTRVTKQSYIKPNKPTIIMYEIQGGGHTWPSGLEYAPRSEVGKTSAQINASDIIAKFFTTLD